MKQNNNKKGINAAKLMRHRAQKSRGGHEKELTEKPDPASLAAHAANWLDHLEQRNYSKKTLNMNANALRDFLSWSEARDLIEPHSISKTHLESYQRHLWHYRKKDKQPLGISTQRQRLGSIQRLFAWLCRQNFLPANPAADLILPRPNPKQLPRGLSPTEIARLFAIPDTRDPLGIRDRAILETFYATGIRRNELINLDVADLDLSSRTLHVRRGKGGKSRLVPVGKTALLWLDNYLLNTRPKLLLNTSEQALFISGYGERLSNGYLGNWMKKTMREAGIDRHGSCHLLRHTCATHMLENGADIRIIQQLLGHQNLDTTSHYTQVAIHHLQSVYDGTHPSSKTDSQSKSSSVE